MLPLITKAQVVTQAPPDGVNVLLPSGQIPGFPVKVGTHGPADAFRVEHDPLPTPGTWGLVAFPAGDDRNGIWICSFYAQKTTAHNSTTDANAQYSSHYSGAYESMDSAGNKNIYFPDGTTIIISASGTLATTYRQTVNPQQAQQPTVLTPSQRIPSPPSPFYVTVEHPSGASVTITPSGTINVNAAAGQKINMTSGGAAASNSLALVSALVAAFNSHTHPGTSTPTTPLTNAQISSAVVEVSA